MSFDTLWRGPNGRLLTLVLLAAALTAVTVAAPALARAPSRPAVAAKAKPKPKPKKAKCIYGKVAGKRTCLRLRAVCQVGNRSAYLLVRLDCVRGRLARATPTALRQGRYVALPASGVPTRAEALAAFDQSVASLPGVSPPKGTVASTSSGSAALRWVTKYRKQLTAAQRRVFDQALAPQPGDQTVDIDADGDVVGAPTAPTAPTTPPPTTPTTTPTTPAPVPSNPTTPPPIPTNPVGAPAARAHAATTPDDFMEIVREATPRLKAHGLVLRHPITVSFLTYDKGFTQADSYPLWLQGTGNSCHVRIYPQAQASTLEFQRQVIAHELTHCAQFESMTSLDAVGATPGWVLDGTAEYVAYNVAIEWNGFLPSAGWWNTWLRSSTTSLYPRNYDAVGFWSLLAADGANVYGLIDPIVRAGSSGNNSAAYAAAVSGLDGNFTYDWGSTLAMVSALGPLWNLNGPGVTRPALLTRPVRNDGTARLSFDQRGAVASGLNVTSDVVDIGVSSGVTGRLHTPQDVDVQLASEMDFCAKEGGCDCPDGSPSPASDYPPIPQGVSYIGAANPNGAGEITVSGISLDDLCKERKKPPSDAGGGGDGGPGLQLQALTENGASLVGTITSGTCAFAGKTFTAKGSGSGYTLQLRIVGANQPGTYSIPIGAGGGGTVVTVKGGKTYSSQAGNLDGGTGGNGTAVIVRRPVRVGKRTVMHYRLIVGITPLFSGGKPGLAIVPSNGGLNC